MDLDSKRQGKAVVLKTTTRQTIFLPVIGLVDGGERTRRPEKIQPPLSFSVVTHRTDGSSGAFFYPSSRSPRFTHAHAHTHADKLKPADLVGVNKDSYLILDMLPAEYDSRVKAMEVDEKPTEDYTDIGGCLLYTSPSPRDRG